jgi:Cd2+/Zn2+-exporting ATPase
MIRLHSQVIINLSSCVSLRLFMYYFVAASVGVAMGAAGAAMAVNTADVVLMSENLLRIPQTLDLAKFTRRIIFQNVCFSLCVKLIAIILAFFGFIILWNAIIIDMGCLVAVALNGIRPLNLQVIF